MILLGGEVLVFVVVVAGYLIWRKKEELHRVLLLISLWN